MRKRKKKTELQCPRTESFCIQGNDARTRGEEGGRDTTKTTPQAPKKDNTESQREIKENQNTGCHLTSIVLITTRERPEHPTHRRSDSKRENTRRAQFHRVSFFSM
jgi:hypothetical protein